MNSSHTIFKVVFSALLLVASAAGYSHASGITLSTQCYNHAATMLQDGRFIVVGGTNYDGTASHQVGSMEIYYATSTSFVTLTSSKLLRSSHTVTLLGNGNVLIAGGIDDGGGHLDTAIIFHPLTNTITDTSAMNQPHAGHTATLLKNGRVLIAGGTSSAEVAATTAELYDPTSNSFIPVPTAMITPRWGHTATLLRSSMVYISGGKTSLPGFSNVGYVPGSEVYDPNQNAFIASKATLWRARSNHTATLLANGYVVTAGGKNVQNYYYDPAGFCENATGSDICQKTIDGTYVEYGTNGYENTTEMYDPYADVSIPVAPMPGRVSQHAAYLNQDGTVHVVGGIGNFDDNHITSAFTIRTSTIVLAANTTCTLDDCNNGTIVSEYSTLSAILPAGTVFSPAVTGQFIDARVISPIGSSITTGDAIITFTQPPIASLNGQRMMQGLASTNISYSNTSLVGDVTFPKQTSITATASFTADPTFTFTPASLEAGDKATLNSGNTMAVEVTIPMDISDYVSGTSKIVKYAAAINTAAMTFSDVTVSLSSVLPNPAGISINNSASATVYYNSVTAKYEALVPMTFSQLTGSVINTSTEPVTSPYSASGTIDSMTMSLLYFVDKITPTGMKVVPNLVATMTVNLFNYADDMQFTPQQTGAGGAWTIGTPIAYWITTDTFMTFPRFSHSALLTPGGDVILTGGRMCSSGCSQLVAVNNVDFLLADMEKWTTDSSLNNARAQHSATLLSDGRILIAGGTNATATLSSSEILSAFGEKWVNTSKPMPIASAGHTATLLPNGNVLTTGGYFKTPAAQQVILSSASIYYPASDSWTAAAAMPFPRQGHTAVYLPFGPSAGNVAVIGGMGSVYLSSTTVYISTQNVWLPLASMNAPRARHTATTLKDGRILVIGGLNGVGGTLGTCEIYNPLTNTWTLLGSTLSHPRHSHTATLLSDGRVMVFGGDGGTGELLAPEIYTPETSTWADATGITPYDWPSDLLRLQILPRFRHTATLLPNGKVIIAGGLSSLNKALDDVGLYSVDISSWGVTYPLVTARGDHSMTLMRNGMLYAAGGFTNSGYTASTESIYFMISPDDPQKTNTAPTSERMPVLLSDTTTFDHTASITIYTSSHNFFGVTEANSGGTNNSSQSHPRVTMQMIDNPSGYLTDMSTIPFSGYGTTQNTDWGLMQSSITLTTPNLPYGWYHLRASNGGVYSDGFTMFVSSPLPQGQPGVITRDSTVAQSTNTLAWVWKKAASSSALMNYADGYDIYNSTDGVFISTAAIPSGDQNVEVKYIQTSGLKPNMAAAISVDGYNISGTGPKTTSPTFYTLATPPTNFRVSTVSFVSAILAWDTINSTFTAYEISMSQNDFSSTDVTISTPMPFSPTTNNMAEISNLSPGKRYTFRIRAQNNEGVTTTPYLYTSTITIGSVSSIQGSPNTVNTIFWNWPSVTGATHYYVYNENQVLISTVAESTNPSYSQVGLSTNTVHSIFVQAVNLDSAPVNGMMVQSSSICTLADTPTPYVLSPYVTTALTATGYWSPATNPTGTTYVVETLKDDGKGNPVAYLTEQVTQDDDYMSFLDHTVADLPPNTKFYMRVYAINKDDVKTSVVWLSTGTYTLSQPPAAKSVLSSAITASSFQVLWVANSNPATTLYQVELASAQTGPYTAATNLAFANSVVKTTVTVTNLLTSTQYFVQVRSRNGDGVVSAPTAMLPPSLTTLSGPLGTPTGFISGFSSSGEITGTLPDGRTMTMTIPAGSFDNDVASPVEIAFGEGDPDYSDPCKTYSTDYPTVLPVFRILTTNNRQPSKPLTLTFSYFPGTPDELGGRAMTDLAFALLNKDTMECLPLQTNITKTPRQVSTTLNHLSTFQLDMLATQTTLDNVAIYPNPFYPSRGNGFVTFSKLPVPAKIRIYTLSGEKVWEGAKTNASPLIWDGKNSAGEQVASGVYLALIDGAGQKKIRKVAVER